MSTPALTMSGCLAAIAATSASESPSDFRKAAASPGAEAAATLPRLRAVAALLFAAFDAAAVADVVGVDVVVENRDLPVEDANVGPWPLRAARARPVDCIGVGGGIGIGNKRGKAPTLAGFRENRATDVRIVARVQRFRAEEERRRGCWRCLGAEEGGRERKATVSCSCRESIFFARSDKEAKKKTSLPRKPLFLSFFLSTHRVSLHDAAGSDEQRGRPRHEPPSHQRRRSLLLDELVGCSSSTSNIVIVHDLAGRRLGHRGRRRRGRVRPGRRRPLAGDRVRPGRGRDRRRGPEEGRANGGAFLRLRFSFRRLFGLSFAKLNLF